MRTALKAGVVLLPFAAFFLIVRACAGGEAETWRQRAAQVDPAAVIAVDEEDLIVIAPSKDIGQAAAALVRDFRRAVVRSYGDLLGNPGGRRMVILVFPGVAEVQAYAGAHVPERDPGTLGGYTDLRSGAIIIPADSLGTLRHETIHWIVGTAHPGTPEHSPWLSEGLAQLFETWDPDASPPQPPALGPEDSAAVWVLMDDTIDVERLVRMEDYGEFVGADGTRNYLEALVLTAFLFEKRPRDVFARYLEEDLAVQSGRPELFDATFQPRGRAFQDDLRAYLRELKGE